MDMDVLGPMPTRQSRRRDSAPAFIFHDPEKTQQIQQSLRQRLSSLSLETADGGCESEAPKTPGSFSNKRLSIKSMPDTFQEMPSTHSLAHGGTTAATATTPDAKPEARMLLRRLSSFAKVSQDVKRRTDFISFVRDRVNSMKKPIPRIVKPNTYQLQPQEDEKFRYEMIQSKVEAVLEKEFSVVKSYKQCGHLKPCDIAEAVKEAVKVCCPRHKIISHVILLENRQQGTKSATRCLWDTQHDNMVIAKFSKNDIHCTATVYGIYYE